MWVIDVVEKDNMVKVVFIIVLNGYYFLRMRIKCDGMVSKVKVVINMEEFFL